MPKLLTYPELKAMGVVYTRQHLGKLEADDKFPKRVRLGEARVAWVEQEIVDWIEAKMAARKSA